MALWKRKPKPRPEREHYGRTVSPAVAEAHKEATKKFNRRHFSRPA